jgi:hypothetical protein
MRHPNLCLFLGVCIPAQGKVWVVNAWMTRGTLFSVHSSLLPVTAHRVEQTRPMHCF